MGKYKVQIVNCWSLNVRTGPSTSYKIIQWCQRGEIWTSSKQSNGWYWIDEKGGYSQGNYVKPIQNLDPPPQPPKPYVPPNPGTNGNNLPKGSYATIKRSATHYATGEPIPNEVKGIRYKILDVKEWITNYSKRAYFLEPPVNHWVLEQDIVESGVSNGLTEPPVNPPKPTPPPKPPIDYKAIDQMLASGQSTDQRFLAFSEADTRVPKLEEWDTGLKPMDSGTNVFIHESPTLMPRSPMRAALGPTPFAASTGTRGFGSQDVTIRNYNLDYGFIKDNLDIIRRNYNIVGESSQINDDLFLRFNRFRVGFPDNQLSKTFPQVFFTRPDLNLMEGTKLHSQLENDPLYSFLWNNNPMLLQALTEKFTESHDFHPYLSNAARSFDVSDEFIKTTEHGETFTGYKMLYGRHNIESNTAGQFTIQYQDDKNYTLYKTHKAWTEYISRVYRGALRPAKVYIKNRILDYASSVYYFVTGPDGETLLFWSKYFGVFPLNTPASAASWTKGSGTSVPEFGINYAYAFKEDFSPVTLAEFNKNSSGDFVFRKTYDPITNGQSRTLSGAPFIESSKDSKGTSVYKLKFRK